MWIRQRGLGRRLVRIACAPHCGPSGLACHQASGTRHLASEDAAALGEFYAKWQVPRESKRELTRRRERVVRSLLKAGIFTSGNFAPEELTEAALYATLILIDCHFFPHQSLLRLVFGATRGDFALRVQDHVPGEYNTTAFFSCETTPDDGRSCDYHILFQRHMWGRQASRYCVDGIRPGNNKVRVLVTTLCHELTHLLAFLAAGNASHDTAFGNLTHALFGHALHKTRVEIERE
jgi:hypothetical protein